MCSTRWLVHNRYAREDPAGEFGELMFYIEHTLKNPLPKLPHSSVAVVKIQGHWQCTLLGGWFTTATLAPKGIIGGPAGESGSQCFTLKNPPPQTPVL